MARGVYVGVPDFEKVNLPTGYTQVKYIQSSGTQFIDTGFIPKSTTRVVMDCEVTYTADWIMIFGAYNANAYYSWWAVGSSMKPYYGSANLTISGDTGRMTLDANGNAWSVGGNSVTFSAQTFTATSTAYIFSVNNGWNYANASMKLYSCKIWDNGTMVRNYVPCVDASGTVGLYDLVNSKFYTNAGTGQFFAPEPVTLPSGYKQVEYLQSSGTQWINSNFYPSGNALRIVTKFKYTTAHDGLSLFGNSTSGQFAITAYGSQPVFYVGTSNAVSCGEQTSLNTPYTLDVTANNGTLTAIWNGTTYTASYSGTLRTDRPMYIFGSNDGSGVAETGSGYLLEGIQFYDNGSLVRNYIPCTNNSGTAGLYDLVNGTFYGNSGTGTFVAGTEISAEPKSLARKVKQIYVGVSDKARRVKKAYIGIGGVARPFWSKGLEYYGVITSLTAAKSMMASASGKHYAVFAGGQGSGSAGIYNTVDAYNSSLVRSTPTNLGEQKASAKGGAVGDYVLIAGGYYGSKYYNTVQAYNASLTRSSPTYLSYTCINLASANVAERVIFAGGAKGSTYTAKVDSYNTSLTKTTCTDLSTGAEYIAGASVGNYAILAGGKGSSYMSTVTTYNASLTKGTATALSSAKSQAGGATAGGYALIAGGIGSSGAVNTVDAYNESLTKTTITPLTSSKAYLENAGTSLGDFALFVADGKVYSYDSSLTKQTDISLSRGTYGMNAVTIGNYALFTGAAYAGNATNVVDAVVDNS